MYARGEARLHAGPRLFVRAPKRKYGYPRRTIPSVRGYHISGDGSPRERGGWRWHLHLQGRAPEYTYSASDISEARLRIAFDLLRGQVDVPAGTDEGYGSEGEGQEAIAFDAW